jgi:hypothetical protein
MPTRINPTITKDVAQDMYINKQMSMKELAKFASVTDGTVKRWLIEWNIPVRDVKETFNIKRFMKFGDKNHRWKNGKTKNYGYIVLNPLDDPFKRGKKRVEHLIISEQRVGRILHRGECVHHLDGNKLNNNPMNLCMMPSCTHSLIHKILGDVGMKQLINGDYGLVLELIDNNKYRSIIVNIYVHKKSLITEETRKCKRHSL